MDRTDRPENRILAEASPFHEGEQAVQRRLGVREDIEPWASRVVRPFLPEQHRDFYGTLPFLVVAARDGKGRPWATLLSGAPGFVRSPDARQLVVGARPVPGDALEKAFVAGTRLGLLGIELATRRRNRVNGRIVEAGALGFDLAVDQAFGNCPQYIHPRAWHPVAPPEPRPARRATRLTPSLRRWIESSDTFFIATGTRGDGASAAHGMDASHRGGEPGFVQLEDEGHLVFPDYAGNNHFNTIGNLLLDPQAGLLFVDFVRGSLLQLTGRVTVDWDSPAVACHPGARRLLHFALDEAVVLERTLPLRWSEPEEGARQMRVRRKVRESADVVSLLLETPDGADLPGFTPGQHLPIELDVRGEHERVRRTYSLSGPPASDHYRISVKREPRGVASRHLHDEVGERDLIDVRAPAGHFVLEAGERPVVLLSAGVGVTPMVGMLHALAGSGDARPVHFVHVARDGRHHAFAREIRRLAGARPGIRVHVSYSRPRPEDRPGHDFDAAGRLDGARVAAWVPDLDADFYLCGPIGFMTALQDDLERRGVAAGRIHSERFGPAR